VGALAHRDLSAGASVRYTDSDNDAAAGLRIPLQPRWTGQVRLDYLNRSGYRSALVWRHVGDRLADVGGASRLPGYDTLDLSLARQLDLHWDVYANIENCSTRTTGCGPGILPAARRYGGSALSLLTERAAADPPTGTRSEDS